jgi:hypothetical protein
MCVGLLKRIGLILVAIAFLSGGLPRMSMFSAGSASAVMTSLHAHDMHSAQAAAHPDGDCASPGKKAPACQHPDDCLACVLFDLPAKVRPAAAMSWTRLVFQPSTPSPSGVTPPPELFPPIRQS